jgi:DNA gyrase subunit A
MGLRKGDEVISAGIADDELDMLVVTEQGYGKRTRISDYPVKGRGGLGVKTVQLTEARGQLAGAMPVRDGYQVMLISNGGTVIRMPVDEIKRLGRSTQGVIVMRLRGDEQVSSIALVAESEPQAAELEAPIDEPDAPPDEREPAPTAESGRNE